MSGTTYSAKSFFIAICISLVLLLVSLLLMILIDLFPRTNLEICEYMEIRSWIGLSWPWKQVGSISNQPACHGNSFDMMGGHPNKAMVFTPMFFRPNGTTVFQGISYLKNVIFHELLGWYGFSQCTNGFLESRGASLRLLSWLPFYRPCVSPWMLGFFSRRDRPTLEWLWKILLMAEIPNNHLGCIKTLQIRGKLPINWCRISAINSIKVIFSSKPFVLGDLIWLLGTISNFPTQILTHPFCWGQVRNRKRYENTGKSA